MFSYDYSMIEGPPLQYYSYAPLSPPVNHFYHPYHQRHSDFDLQYLNRFAVPSYDWMSSSEEINMPRSPTNSNQSDSDNSQSSIELSSSARRNVIVSPSTDRLAATTILVPNSTVSKSTDHIQCCWHTCGLEFESLDALATHVSKVHSASGPGGLFYCGWEGCTRNNRGFNARYKMLVHVRTHTNEKPHQCWQCDKSFSRAENLKIHIRSHSGEKPYVCPVAGCAKAYSNSSDRFKHTRTHQVDKPYQCKIPGCSKRYTDPSSLRKHVKTYKHFVNNENQQEIPPPPPTNNRLEEVILTTDCLTGTTSRNNDLTPELVPHMRTSAEISFSTCIQCCRALVAQDEKLCNRCNSSSELYRIGALFTTGKSWRIAPSTKLFTPYDLQECKMDVEMPLDLSMAGRRQTSNVL